MGQARPRPSGLGLEANERRDRTGSPWQAARKTKLTFRQSFPRHFPPEKLKKEKPAGVTDQMGHRPRLPHWAAPLSIPPESEWTLLIL
jgi:hypothetical protein